MRESVFIGHNITCSWTFKKNYVKRYDMGHACLVSYHQVASVVPVVRYWKLAVRIRGTIVAHVCFAVIWRTLKVSPIWADDTHNPRFSRPALRKQFSTHDAVDIITMFNCKLFTLISLPALRFAHAWFNILSFLSQPLII